MAGEGHPKDALQELLDGRLQGEARARVEEHIASCTSCRGEIEALRLTKLAARRAFAAEPAPHALQQRILHALDQEDERIPSRRRRRVILATGLAASVLVAASLYLLKKPPALPVSVAEDYQAYQAGRTELDLRTSDPAALGRFFAERGVAFRTRVLDLGMMRYRLVGGRVHRLRGQTSAFFVYEGPGNRIVICQMFEGTLSDLPAGAVMREQGGISMRAYRVGVTSIAFWQEGKVVCVLASDLPMEDLIRLAFLKAMKV
jgi:anti-sigma factor RsiW